MTANPYQDVIDWLRSPEGEQWSEDRIDLARQGSYGHTMNTYGAVYGPVLMIGVFSIKEQNS